MTGWVISLPPHYATDVVRAESRQRGKVLAKHEAATVASAPSRAAPQWSSVPLQLSFTLSLNL